MKKALLALSLAALIVPIFGLAPQSASANDTIQTVRITDGVVNIDYPSKYAGRTVTMEDGHYMFGKVTLNASGDASIDLKNSVPFRTVAPDSVFLSFQGFANPISRPTNLVKELSGYRLMFKQNFNAQDHFQFSTEGIVAFGDFGIDIVQAGTITRPVISTFHDYNPTLKISNVWASVNPTTQATFSGASRPFTATGTSYMGSSDDPMNGAKYDLPFIFENKRYPGVALR